MKTRFFRWPLYLFLLCMLCVPSVQASTEIVISGDTASLDTSIHGEAARIIFVSDRSGNKDVWIMDADGSNAEQLTTNTGLDEQPVPSPDGSRIAYVSDEGATPAAATEICVMNTDGTNKTQLTFYGNAYCRQPAWSPDAEQIVFVRENGGSWLYQVPSDGSAEPTLLESGVARYNPEFSPDGSHLIYDCDSSGGGWWDLYQRIMPDGPEYPLATASHSIAGAYSHLGDRIVYIQALRPVSQVRMMDADGSNNYILFDNSSATPGTQAYDGWGQAAWSPNDSRVAASIYNSLYPGVLEFENFIQILDPDTETEIYRTTLGRNMFTYESSGYGDRRFVAGNNVWSPDGSHLVFMSNRDGNWEVYIMDTNGGNQTNLSRDSAWDGDPVWCLTRAPATYYVDADATVGGDGETWGTAYKYLQDALTAARSGDEIWVAEGIYKPDEDTAHPDGTGEREATFQLKNGVAIYGGYAGFGEPDPNERDPNTYETILSGDLDCDDVQVDPCDLLDEPSRGENSYHVVTGSWTDETAVLDGFIVTSGNNISDTLVWPRYIGSGMHNYHGSPTLNMCTFTDNSAECGGGMGNVACSNPRLVNCTFIGNSARWGGGGGGMYNTGWDGPCNPTLTNCTFIGNWSANHGGGMANYLQSSPTLTNCEFSDNCAALGDGGGMLNRDDSSPTITNCTFSGNSARAAGGGMFNDESNPTLTNCTFSGNLAEWYGGGMANYLYSNSMLTNCRFSGNSSGGNGGGMSNSWDSNPTLVNCTFIGNSAGGYGGGVLNERGSPTLVNCIFSGNSAGSYGGGMCNWSNSSPTLTNCILWGNNQEQIRGGALALVSYCDVQGGWAGEGNIDADPAFVELGYWADANDPNIPAEPNDPNAIWVDGDYHLLAGSPCIDAGDNTAVPADTTDLDGDGNTTEPVPFDLDGNPRIVDGNDDGIAVVDIGAYEGAVLSPQQLVINRIEDAIAEKLEALEKIDTALEKEVEAYEILEQLLESGDYGDWTRQAILGARWKISIAILYEEDYIKKVLEKTIDKLQRSLSALRVEPDEGNNGGMAVNTGADEAAVLSLHELVINLIEEAIAEKEEALEIVDAALQKERKAYELLEQMFEAGEYGDWKRQDIIRAKSRIYVAIEYDEYLKKVLTIKTIDELEDSLSRLGVEAYDGDD